MKNQLIMSNGSVKKWFESELERRGIDATIHFAYIVTLVEDCCSDCLLVKDIDPKMNDHWKLSENRDIAIQMLQSLSGPDQNGDMDTLVDQLRKKLVYGLEVDQPSILANNHTSNGNQKISDESVEVRNLESKFEQLAVLWMPTDRSPSADNNRSIWSYESTSSDSGPPSPRFQQQMYDDLFGTSDRLNSDDLNRSVYCPVRENRIWASGTSAVDDWLNQEIEMGSKGYQPWLVQRKCSLDNHACTSLFKEVTSKKLDSQVGLTFNHQLPSVPDVQIFDENLLTSPKTHFQPIKNDSWQREVSIIIDTSRTGLVPCSPQCPNRVTSRSNSSENRIVVQVPRPSSVSSKELATFIDPGCEVETEEIVVEPVEEDDVEAVPEPHPVQPVVELSVEESDDECEYEAIESILNQVLNNRPVDEYYEEEKLEEYPEIVQVESIDLVDHVEQQTVNIDTDTYTTMPWSEDSIQDLSSQIMTAETVYLTDDSDDYFLHPTSDVDSSLDFHQDPALLFVYNRPGGLPSNGLVGTGVGQYSKPCSFFLEGNCRKSDCKYSHDFKSIQCKFWLEGSCFKGESCPFLHSDLPLPGGNCDEPQLKDFSMNDMDFPSLAVESSNKIVGNNIGMSSSSSCRESSDKAKSGEWIRSGLSSRTRTTSRESPPLPVTFRLQVGRKKKKKGGSYPKGV